MERRAARDERRNARTEPEQLCHLRCGGQQQLEIIQHKEQLPSLQGGSHLVAQWRLALLLHTECLGDGWQHPAWFQQGGKGDERYLSPDLSAPRRCHLKCQSCLADARGPRQGEQAPRLAREEMNDRCLLMLPSNKRCEGQWQGMS